ncbi:hypothetical protein [Endozoicomonas elysicola]|uniref:Uncharacterized protein n=1 Tax=Endozoicomonas elysicola TaxID=305900 RepID=A0A081KAT2_9GAMM|nr:hypothetical protein [Endozoicomonas elysicola]KEI71258.1 hypothetical protein GV64_11345 [Endozoicomonas elysicola]
MYGANSTNHNPVFTSQTSSATFNDNSNTKLGFFAERKWLVSCSNHNTAIEVLYSPGTNEVCFKKIGDREVNYRQIDSSGYTFRFHDFEHTFIYKDPIKEFMPGFSSEKLASTMQQTVSSLDALNKLAHRIGPDFPI